MAINPNIPLTPMPQPRHTRLAPGILQFQKISRQNRLDEAAEAEAAERSESRGIANEANRLKIQQARDEIERSGNKDKLEDYAQDLLGIWARYGAGDIPGARSMFSDRIQKLTQRGTDTKNTAGLLQLLESEPQKFEGVVQGEIQRLEKIGILERDAKGGLFSAKTKFYTNGTTIAVGPDGVSVVREPSGRMVFGDERMKTLEEAVKSDNPNIKSKEEVQQIVELTRQKAAAGRDQEKRRLEMDALKNQIERGELEIQASKEQKASANALKVTALRLVNELLEDPDAVRAYVGPFDQITPDLLPETLTAKTLVTQLRAILTAENLKLMTGVLSETDLLIIANVAGGGLDINGDDEAFIKELDRLRVSFSNEVGGSPQSGGGLTAEEEAELKALEAEFGQ